MYTTAENLTPGTTVKTANGPATVATIEEVEGYLPTRPKKRQVFVNYKITFTNGTVMERVAPNLQFIAV